MPGRPSSTLMMSSKSWLVSRSPPPRGEGFKLGCQKGRCGDQPNPPPAGQRHLGCTGNGRRIPAVGKPQDTLIGRHQIHFHLAEAPPADRRIGRHVSFKATCGKLPLQSMVVRQGGDLRDDIHVIGHAGRWGIERGAQQACCATADEYQFAAQFIQRRRHPFNQLHVRIPRIQSRSSNSFSARLRSRAFPMRKASNRARFS